VMAARRKSVSMSKSPLPKGVSGEDLVAGSLFAIPLSGGRRAIGQIVIPGIGIFGCAFLPVFSKGEELPTSLSKSKFKPAACFLITDMAFEKGKWPVIGTAPLHPDIPMPHFKTDTDDGADIMDVHEKFVRHASAKDEQTIPYRTIVDDTIVANVMAALVDGGKVDEELEVILASFIRSHR